VTLLIKKRFRQTQKALQGSSAAGDIFSVRGLSGELNFLYLSGLMYKKLYHRPDGAETDVLNNFQDRR
jgi:hypothetical protein